MCKLHPENVYHILHVCYRNSSLSHQFSTTYFQLAILPNTISQMCMMLITKDQQIISTDFRASLLQVQLWHLILCQLWRWLTDKWLVKNLRQLVPHCHYCELHCLPLLLRIICNKTHGSHKLDKEHCIYIVLKMQKQTGRV